MDARSRAVARLARWWNPAATAPAGMDLGRRFAIWRFARAKRAVDRLAARDAAAGVDVAGFVVPRHVRTDAELDGWFAAARRYRTAHDRAAAAEGLRRAPGPAEVPGSRRDRRRWW